MQIPLKSTLLAALLFAGLAGASNPGSAADTVAAITAPLMAGEPSAQDLARARGILEAWENADPDKSGRLMRVVYWTPADRDPQPDFRGRLTRVMTHVQEFYRSQLNAYGFPGRSIQLDLLPDGMLNLPVAKGRLKSEDCQEADSSDGQAIRRDCLAALGAQGIDGENETVVIFCNLTDFDPVARTMSHHSPYYAGGDSRHGTAWQVDSALLDPSHLSVRDQFLTDQQYGRISLGKYNSIFVGGVCHELGHALGLPHCRESAACGALRGTALMGSGNRTYGEDLRGESKGTFLTVGHALKLAAHPQFSGSVKRLKESSDPTFSGWSLSAAADGLKVSGKVVSEIPVHAVLAYADPAGGGDYDALTTAAVPAADGSFSLILPPARTKSQPAVLSFVAVSANGAATAGVATRQAFSLPCRIDGQGQYDISPALAVLEISEHLSAAIRGPLPADTLTKLTPAARGALSRLARPDNADGKPAPDAVSGEIKSLPLSDAAPARALTGYAGVHFDRSPEGHPLISATGPAAHGLWAHADSVFEYSLAGKWSAFSGQCGLLSSGDGPILATIALDGKTVWESGIIKEGAVKTFSIPTIGAVTLTLEIKGRDGKRAAHGAWLEPVLER
ncbi:MAG: hypothetical protein JWL81_2433 [Verrucomicrobiales bacterium]|nr:hypothetical protein [Verrucomicrobiales bacterium]